MRFSTRKATVRLVLLALGMAIGLVGAAGSSTKSAVSTRASGSRQAAATRALAAALRTSRLGPGQRVPGSGPHTHGLTQVAYYNWSGYADDNSAANTYSMVSASWVQPAVTCPVKEDAIVVFWVGLDGFNTSTVEQDGTMAWCFNGTVTYYSWWEMFPTNNIQTVGSTVAPGDKIAASVVFAAGHYALKLTDSTHTANSFSTSQVCGAGLTCPNASAEWIVETPGGARGLWPWQNFRTWHLSAAKVKSGTTTGVIKSFPDDEITIVGTDGQSLSTTGALNTAGNGFGDAWAYSY